MTIKHPLLLLHWCVLLGQYQAAACGSGVMLAPVEPLCPWLPREMIPVQDHSGQEVALLFVIVPRVLLQHRSLAWVTVQCQVIGVSTELLQPNSLLQNPFSSPVPYQVWFFPRNECIEDGWAGWKRLAGSDRLGGGGAGRRLSTTGTESSQTEMSCSSPQPYVESLQSSNCPQLLLLHCLIHQESQPTLFDSCGSSS